MENNCYAVVLLISCMITLPSFTCAEMNAETVYEFLSKRLDSLLMETVNVKVQMKGIDDRLSKVEEKLDGLNLFKVPDSHKESDTQTKIDFTKSFQMQSRAFQRMLSVEKLILKESRKNIEEQFRNLKQDILADISDFKNASDVQQSEVRTTMQDISSKIHGELSILAVNITSIKNESLQNLNILKQEHESQKRTVSLLSSNVSTNTSALSSMISSSLSRISSLSARLDNKHDETVQNLNILKEEHESLKRTVSVLSSHVSTKTSELSSMVSSSLSRISSLSARLDNEHATCLSQISFAGMRNVALHKQVTLSSVFEHYYNLVGSYMVDGNRAGDIGRTSQCAHTRSEDYPWAVIDLGQSYQIKYIYIKNRDDCCAERLHDLTIFAGNGQATMSFQAFHREAIGASCTIRMPQDTKARFVKFQIHSQSESLTLCEVEIYV